MISFLSTLAFQFYTGLPLFRVAAAVASVGVREPCHIIDAVRPPSTTYAPPVQKRDRSDARKTVS